MDTTGSRAIASGTGRGTKRPRRTTSTDDDDDMPRINFNDCEDDDTGQFLDVDMPTASGATSSSAGMKNTTQQPEPQAAPPPVYVLQPREEKVYFENVNWGLVGGTQTHFGQVSVTTTCE